MSDKLSDRKCRGCNEDIPALSPTETTAMLVLVEGWKAVDNHHLTKEFKFKNFKDALEWVNKLGKVAEDEQHHPDIHLSWGAVRLDLWTHRINGITENDFIIAAKADCLR